jgi:hypothetical protein
LLLLRLYFVETLAVGLSPSWLTSPHRNNVVTYNRLDFEINFAEHHFSFRAHFAIFEASTLVVNPMASERSSLQFCRTLHAIQERES